MRLGVQRGNQPGAQRARRCRLSGDPDGGTANPHGAGARCSQFSPHSSSQPALSATDLPKGSANCPRNLRHCSPNDIDIDLPGRPLLLRYRRRLRLTAPVGGEAGFRVAVDGEVVDTASHTGPVEDEWTTRSVSVPDRGARRARLEVTVAASCALNYFPSAEAWVDDVRVA